MGKLKKKNKLMSTIQSKVNLAAFEGSNFDKGAGRIKTIVWYFVNAFFVRASWNPFMLPKIAVLRLFGARIGKGLVLKNNVVIKSPWNITIGDNCWIGEGCWIDNIDKVCIEDNVCISQGALLLTGNHDYTKPSMPYRNAPITLKSGVWIGAQGVVCPGVTAENNSILTVGSVATKNMEANGIYQGNPAKMVRTRVITNV